ncbi:MAG: ABC transporter substrate-binding protein [Firmicutes bacterium]|nr:ABC transporter substrate-binding protein [Bacillota bacterium]
MEVDLTGKRRFSRKNIRMMLLLAALVLLTALLALGCSVINKPKSGTQKVVVGAFQWSADQAMILLAAEKGWFKDEGLDVEFVMSGGSAQELILLANGTHTFGEGGLDTGIKAAAEGLPVKNVFVLYQQSPRAIIYSDKTLKEPKDVIGKTIAVIPTESEGPMLPLWLKANGIDPGQVNIVNTNWDSQAPMLMSGQADGVATWCASLPFMLKDQGKPDGCLMWKDTGLPTLHNGIFTNSFTLKNQPEMVRKFLRVLRKGFDATRDNPEAAVAAVPKYCPDCDIELEKRVFYKNIELWQTPRAKAANLPLGVPHPDDWEDTVKIFNELGIGEGIPATSYYDYSLIEK